MSLVWSPDYAPVDGDFADVSLLLKGEGTNGSTTILDSSSNNLSVTVNGDAQISTAVNTPFGTGDGVLALDGNGDNLKVPASSLFAYGTGDFTWEWWSYQAVLNGYTLDHGFNEGSIASNKYYNSSVVSTVLYTTGFAGVTTNTWHYFTVARKSGVTTLYLDGVETASAADPYNYTGRPLTVGSYGGNGFYLNGYISNLRITKGVARYTSNFTPPTAPFPILSPSTRIEVGDGFDVDAANYILAVEAADTAALEPAVRTAINDFVVGCKSDGIWNAIKASCILAGARTLEGALVPLAGTAPTKFGTEGNWNYNRKTGLQGDGSTNYVNASRAGDADPQDNRHVAIYASTAISNNGALLNAGEISAGATSIEWFNGQIGFRNSSASAVGVIASPTGLVGSTRTTSASIARYLSGASAVSSLASTTPSASGYRVFTWSPGGPTTFSNARIAFYSIGEALDLAKLDSRISAFITAIGAAI
jgi:hypothetical protein